MFDRARLFVACCTLVMLTATVMHRQAVDGREGIHLSFMPCLPWEIPESEVWLSIIGQYRGADFSILQSERARWLIKQEPDLAAEIEYRYAHRGDDNHAQYNRYEEYMLYQMYEQHQEQEEYEAAGKHDDRAGDNIARRALRRVPHVPDLPRDDIPVAYEEELQTAYAIQYLVVERPAAQPASWRDTAPTPPPRPI